MLSPWMDQVVLLGGTEQDSHDDLPRKIYDYGAKGSRLHFVPDVLKTRAAHDWIIGASGGGKPELPLVALVASPPLWCLPTSLWWLPNLS